MTVERTRENSSNSVSEFRTSISQFTFASSVQVDDTSISARTSLRTKSEDLERKKSGDSGSLSQPVRSSPRKRIRKDSPNPSEPNRLRSPRKRKRGYAAPETYAHLNVLQDNITNELNILFCGINPGYLSASIGHHYANPTNHFWRCLHQSGLTDRLVPPTEDFTLPDSFSFGFTNLVDRPSSEQAELSTQEMVDSVPSLLSKIGKFRPRIICFLGKGIWLIVEKNLKPNSGDGTRRPDAKRSPHKGKGVGAPVFSYGLQPYKFIHTESDVKINVRETLFFVSPSSSARVVSHQLADKAKLFVQLRRNLEEYKNGEIDTTSMTPVTL